MSLSTQCKDILDYCNDNHGEITPMEAIGELGVMRLAARIHDLEGAGYVFEHIWVKFITRNGRRGKYMRYKKVS